MREGGRRAGLAKLRIWLPIILLGFATVGCNDSHITDAIWVANHTSGVLRFDIVLTDGSRFSLTTEAPPGQTVRLLDGSQLSDDARMTRGRCTVGEIRALTRDGRVVSRIPPPVCASTTIEVGSSTSPS
jgi:hypothetical protein